MPLREISLNTVAFRLAASTNLELQKAAEPHNETQKENALLTMNSVLKALAGQKRDSTIQKDIQLARRIRGERC